MSYATEPGFALMAQLQRLSLDGQASLPPVAPTAPVPVGGARQIPVPQNCQQQHAHYQYLHMHGGGAAGYDAAGAPIQDEAAAYGEWAEHYGGQASPYLSAMSPPSAGMSAPCWFVLFTFCVVAHG